MLQAVGSSSKFANRVINVADTSDDEHTAPFSLSKTVKSDNKMAVKPVVAKKEADTVLWSDSATCHVHPNGYM
jgi:hypothetical protein